MILSKKSQIRSKIDLSNQFKSKDVIHNTKLKNSPLLIRICLLSVVKDRIIDNLLTSWNWTAESHFSQVTSLKNRTREAREPSDHCYLLSKRLKDSFLGCFIEMLGPLRALFLICAPTRYHFPTCDSWERASSSGTKWGQASDFLHRKSLLWPCEREEEPRPGETSSYNQTWTGELPDPQKTGSFGFLCF